MKNMHIYNKLKTIGLGSVLSVTLLVGCQDFLDQEPQDSVTELVYFETPEHFENAANALYTRLGFDHEGNQGTQGDVSSDISGNLGSTPSYGSGNIVTPTTDDIWSDNYDYLRRPNQIIQKATEYAGVQSEIETSVGTAYFFRAWHHFKLMQRFGGVPLAIQAFDVDSPEIYGARNSRYEVTYQILADLDQAIGMLPSANSMSTSDQGKLSLEAARAFKARVLLYEATWEKYVGTSTDGDGVTVGAGSSKPSDYPSIESMLTDAKQESLEVINSGAFELWDHRADLGEEHLFYLYNLEDGGSNPAGLTKADNKEFIFQTVFDFTYRQIRKNLTHAKGTTPSRKMMDMYLCTDGLPVQHSAVFQGYDDMISEFQNRDYRLKSFVNEPLKEYWGWGANTNGGGAQYGVDFADSGVNFDYRYIPQLQSPGAGRNLGYQGRKFTTEYILRETNQESFNYPQIRLAEVMLIYAEATVELGNGSISDADLNISINKIRERAGVAPLTNALIAPFADLTMLGEIRRERTIELEGENFRFDDLKRWGIAETELNQNVCTVYIEGTEYETVENPKNPGNNIWYPTAFPLGLTSSEQTVSSYAGIASTKEGALIIDPAGNRNFSRKNYLDAIPTNQITAFETELLQNPEW